VDARGRLYAITISTISLVDDKDCFYISCKGCKRKVTGDTCEKCGEGKGTRPVYMFNMKASDGTGVVSVRIFDERGDELIGIPAETMKEWKETTDDRYKKNIDKLNAQVILLKEYRYMACY